MTMPIKLYVTPLEGVTFPGSLIYKGQAILIHHYGEGCLSLLMNDDLTIRDHVRAVEDFLGDRHTVTREKEAIPSVDFNLDAGDLAVMKPLGKLIWDSVFRKPEPVIDAHAWYQSPQSDEYVYLPNNLRKVGEEAEEYMSNAMYTEVLTHAYRLMCNKLHIRPWVNLVSGERVNGSSVRPGDGAQLTVVGNKAGRLANSRLDDFDDSGYAIEFIQSIMDLEPMHYESKIVHRKVLAKVEHILMGKSSHTYNQRFIQKLFENILCTDATTLLSVLTGMVTDGLVLEDSRIEFTSRILRTGLAAEAEVLTRCYGECCGK